MLENNTRTGSGMMSNILHGFQQWITAWSKPATPALISGLFTDLARSHTNLILSSLASGIISLALAAEVARPTENLTGNHYSDPKDGEREHLVGSGANTR